MISPRVLMTGATGFVGSHVAKRLVDAGWDVHVLARPSSDLRRLGFIDETTRVHVLPDEAQQLQCLFAAIQPELVIHLASLFLVEHRPSEVRPLIESNVLFGTQLLEAMVATGVRSFINTSSYWTHYQGNAYLPANLYAATKQAFNDILKYYVDAKGVRAITLELYDTYGPNDPRPKILNLLKHIAENDESLAMSPGMQRLDLVHVDDVANAYLRTSKGLMAGEWDDYREFSIRSGQPLTLRELVAIIENEVGRPLNITWGGRLYRDREVMEPYAECPSLPDWHCEKSLRTYLKEGT